MRRRIGLWLCEHLGWHPQRYIVPSGCDGCSIEAICMRCGYEGLLDSNGDLF
jgi:hypothetical protein